MGSRILFAFSAVLFWLQLLVRVEVDAQVGVKGSHRRLQEVVALTNFKNQFAVVTSPYFSTWNEKDENTCEWAGVTCTSNYTVVALQMSNWELTSSDTIGVVRFAPLSNLTDLRLLDLSGAFSYNFANGISDDIGSLNQISQLDLSNNGFIGNLPSSISACTSLQSLSLESNLLGGTIPDLSGLVDLQFLLLTENFFFGSFPKELGQMSSLVTVDISFNLLNGTIPSLLNSTSLVTLVLDSNSLVGFEEPMHINAPNLQKLSVSENSLAGIIPRALGSSKLLNLSSIDLSYNFLSGTIPSGLVHIPQGLDVYFLNLVGNQLSGSIPPDLIQPPNLQLNAILTINPSVTIWVSGNLLTGSIPNTSTELLSSYGYFDFSYNQLSGPIPESILLSTGSLNLEYNLLSGDIVDALAAVAGSGPFELLLGNNYLSGDLSRLASMNWTNWTTINVIDLSYNNLSWRVSESIPDPISAVLYTQPTVLAQFLVGGNNFSGTSLPIAPIVPANGSTVFQVLDLSNCHLHGWISGSVFGSMGLMNLTTLNLSHNSVTGPIPQNITGLPTLTVLDLSYNNLSGPLPPIPPASVLNNQSFFVGNDGLCGYPLASCPEYLPSHGTGVQWWTLLIIVGGSLMIAAGSCLMVSWRWRVYSKLHEQDADLIKTLKERELVTLMPLRHLKKATNNFAESAQIGEGGFGTVYVGQLDGTAVAIKRSKREGSEKDKEQFLNEVKILSQVNHRHLVKLMGCCLENKIALLVFEFISNGTLQDHLRGKVGDQHLSWKQRLNIAVQTADALNYLHSATSFPIYHRDVKSANILLNDDLSAKVADFGISKLAPGGATHVSTELQGTIGYMDPEYWISFQLTDKSDVFSFGVVLLELISAKPAIDFLRGGEETSLVNFATPFIQSENLQRLIDPTIIGTYSEQSGLGKKSIFDVGRLALRCVEMQSNARPSMNEVWKALQDICLKFDGTFVLEEDLSSVNNGDRENHFPNLGDEILLSPLPSGNRSDSLSGSLRQYDGGRLELTDFSQLRSGR